MVGESEGRRLVEEVAAIYDGIEARMKQDSDRAGCCRGCGACCDFLAYDHRLFVTPPELMYLAAKLGTPELKLMATGWCPYQQGTTCTVREYRFAACRIFCCTGEPDFQSELSEEALKRLKLLCQDFGIAYRYQDLATALGAFNGDTYRSAAGSCPADRED